MTWYVLYGKNGEILMKTQDKTLNKNLIEVPIEPVLNWDGKMSLHPIAKPQNVMAAERIEQLKSELAALDYKQFKFLRGELSPSEWLIIKTEIQSKISRIHELEKIMCF